MARSRRNSELEMNFDGLTDSITDLVGTLTLLIVLVFSATHEARDKSDAPPPTPDWQSVLEANSGSRPINPLLRQVEELRQNIVLTDRQIKEQEASMTELRDRAAELQKRIQALESE